MRILLFGASGMIGSRIAAEALGRGHALTAATRSGETGDLTDPQLTAVVADASDAVQVAELAAGHDVVASALAPPRDGSEPTGPFVAANQALIEGTRAAGVRRLMVVGGAGSLRTSEGTALVDAPGFPDALKPEALAHRAVLDIYRQLSDLDWTYLSPAAEIRPGERTGVYRLGKDQLLTDSAGRSRISAEDYAVAFLDEAENPAHVRRRFCVAY